jgi:paraquat-inducible protein A
VLALPSPLFQLRILNRSGTSSLFSGPAVLRDHGLLVLAVAVFVTLVLIPAAKLIVELVALFGIGSARRPWVAWLFGWLEHISPWAMVDVFLLGAIVAYSRLQALAHVEVGLSCLALGGTMLAIVAVDATLDREAIWQALNAGTPRVAQNRPPSSSPTPSGRLIGCSECHAVSNAEEGARCPRCSHHLRVRKGSVQAACALLVAAALLYIPANVLPVMTIKRLGQGSPTTIFHGVIELAQAHLWPLALLVLLASIVIPIFKLVSLVVMLTMTQRRSSSLLKARTRLFRFVRFIGRWSMIDIFMLSVLVGVVRFGSLASILPGMGAVAFCAVVLITMGVTELFDPRRMWDAAGKEEEAFEGKELAGVQR